MYFSLFDRVPSTTGPVFTKPSYAKNVRRSIFRPIVILDISLAKTVGQWDTALTKEKFVNSAPEERITKEYQVQI